MRPARSDLVWSLSLPLPCLSCVKSAADGTKTKVVALLRCKQRFVINAWTVALLASTALHAGFQLKVTLSSMPHWQACDRMRGWRRTAATRDGSPHLSHLYTERHWRDVLGS